MLKWKEIKDLFGATAHRRHTAERPGKAPNDFDGCWNISGVDPTKLDPVLLDFSDGRAAQKAKYLGELFPAEIPEGASGRTFLEFFQIDKHTGGQKGIVGIDLEDFP